MTALHRHHPAWLWLIGLVLGALTLGAQTRPPADMSMAAFEKFKANLGAELQRAVDREYAGEEERIAKLAQPFRKGERITVTVRRGNMTQQVSGIYKDFQASGMYGHATVGDRQLLLSDIDELDRERLRLGHSPEMLTQYIRGLRDALAEKKEGKKLLLEKQLLSDAGYTDDFFRQTVALGGRYWYLRELGDGAIRLLVDIPATGEVVTLTLQGRLEMPNHALVLNDKTPLMTSFDAPADGPLGPGRVWQEVVGKAARGDGWQEPARVLRGELTLWLLADDTGHWYLRGRPRVAPRQDPESGAWRGEFIFQVLPNTIREDAATAGPAMLRLAAELRQRQQELADRLRAAEEERQRRQAGMADEERQRQEELERLQSSAAAREKLLAEVDERYGWLPAEDARVNQRAEGYIESQRLFNGRIDDSNGPSFINDHKVLRVSAWTMVREIHSEDRARRLEVLGAQHRMVEVQLEGGPKSYLVQTAMSVSNGGTTRLNLQVSQELVFNNGEKVLINQAYELLPSWFGVLLAVAPVSQDQLLSTVKSLAVTVTPAAP